LSATLNNCSIISPENNTRLHITITYLLYTTH